MSAVAIAGEMHFRSVPEPCALSHCQFDAWCFTASFSDLPPMLRIVYAVVVYLRVYVLFSLRLLSPLLPAFSAGFPSEAGRNVTRGSRVHETSQISPRRMYLFHNTRAKLPEAANVDVSSDGCKTTVGLRVKIALGFLVR